MQPQGAVVGGDKLAGMGAGGWDKPSGARVACCVSHALRVPPFWFPPAVRVVLASVLSGFFIRARKKVSFFSIACGSCAGAGFLVAQSKRLGAVYAPRRWVF